VGGAPSANPGSVARRVKMIEDFSDLGEPETFDESAHRFDVVPKSLLAPRREKVERVEASDTESQPPPRPAPMPVFTEERVLRADAKKRWRMAAIAAGVLLLGGLAFAGAAKFSGSSRKGKARPDPEPVVNAIDSAMKYADPAPPPPPRLQEEKAPAAGQGYLTIESDVPAVVFIDGTRIKRTPLRKHAVAAGARKIALVNVKTGERREFKLTIEPGKVKKLEEQFKKR
jgi:eukaryotic-like serine/threonine-protein kinase